MFESHACAVAVCVYAPHTSQLSSPVVKVYSVVIGVHARVHVGNVLSHQASKEGGVSRLLAVRNDVSGGKVEGTRLREGLLLHIWFVIRTRVLLVEDEILGRPQGNGRRFVVVGHVGRTLKEVVVLKPLLLVPRVPPAHTLHGERHALAALGGHGLAAVNEPSRHADVGGNVVLTVDEYVAVCVEGNTGRDEGRVFDDDVFSEQIDRVRLLHRKKGDAVEHASESHDGARKRQVLIGGGKLGGEERDQVRALHLLSLGRLDAPSVHPPYSRDDLTLGQHSVHEVVSFLGIGVQELIVFGGNRPVHRLGKGLVVQQRFEEEHDVVLVQLSHGGVQVRLLQSGSDHRFPRKGEGGGEGKREGVLDAIGQRKVL